MNIKKELPKYFIVKRDSSNPLWDKYINWLNKTYNVTWAGTGYTYYGFDGAVGVSINMHFKNNPTLLSLEEWDSIVNPKEMYTIEQIKEQRIAVVCNSKEEGQKLYKALVPSCPFLHNFQNKNKFEVFWDKGQIEWAFEDKDFKYFERYGDNKATKTIEFNQVIFENMEQKEEIIGYKLIRLAYSEVVNQLIPYGGRRIDELQIKNTFTFKDNLYSIEAFRKVGVLDLWFEPVFKAKEQKYTLSNGKEVIITKEHVICAGENVKIEKFQELVNYYKNVLQLHSWIVTVKEVTFKIGCWEDVKLSDIQEIIKIHDNIS